MIYLKENFWADTDFPEILKPYFENMKVGVFDIETTGLMRERCHFILGGLLTPLFDDDNIPDGDMLSEQFFAETRREEKEALAACLDRLAELDAVITYNGINFDIPFIIKRAEICGLQDRLVVPYNFDLYRMINKFSQLRKVMPDLKQKTVENFYGLRSSRDDMISGAESVELYEEWERTKDERLREFILLHNSDDIKQLAKLVPIVKKADVHRGMSNIGFPAGDLTVENIKIVNDKLIFSGIQRKNPVNYYSYDDAGTGVRAQLDKETRSFSFTIDLIRKGLLTIVDVEKLLDDYTELEKYPYCSSGYAVIEQNEERHYDIINNFIRKFVVEFRRKTGSEV